MKRKQQCHSSQPFGVYSKLLLTGGGAAVCGIGAEFRLYSMICGLSGHSRQTGGDGGRASPSRDSGLEQEQIAIVACAEPAQLVR